VVIALGDSVTSGHHLARGRTVCQSPRDSYAWLVFQHLKGRSPATWGDDGQYHNLAYSGAGTRRTIAGPGPDTGGVLDGGRTACGEQIPRAPIDDAVALLADRASRNVRGNKVVITAGINDTNWTAVLTSLLTAQFFNLLANLTAAQCTDLMFNGTAMVNGRMVPTTAWDGPGKRPQMLTSIYDIVTSLYEADPQVGVYWVRYYNMAGTGAGRNALPAACRDAVAAGLQVFNGTTDVAFSVYPFRLQLVSTAPMDGDNRKFQQDAPGWPHPNAAGHRAIADEVIRLLP
jgi:lysophospholipase L1-like esterase